MPNKIISSFLSHPGWQGVGVIIAFIGLIATYMFNDSSNKNEIEVDQQRQELELKLLHMLNDTIEKQAGMDTTIAKVENRGSSQKILYSPNSKLGLSEASENKLHSKEFINNHKVTNNEAMKSSKKSANNGSVPIKTGVISIFEEQGFKLCGYDNFKAKLYKDRKENSKIKLYSNDRKIPKRTIQGFYRIVDKETLVDIFPGCSVMASYEILANTARIIISYSEVR